MKPVLLLKLGTAAITLPDGSLNLPLMEHICGQLATLHRRYRLLLVSSGAVGSGKPFIRAYKGTINQKKAAAAIGNPLLMATYARMFQPHGIVTAQCLLERDHFNRRKHFVQLKNTISELWNSGAVPIANDNDVVNDLELRFSDNDELATLLAVAFDAEALLIGSSVDGLLDAEGRVIPQVEALNETVFGYVRPDKSAQGLGGMSSKLSHTRKATAMGIPTVIFNARQTDGVTNALAGTTGTRFLAGKSSLNARQKWLSSGRTHGAVVLDEGAAQAILARKSLLTVGIRRIRSPFLPGELVELLDPRGNTLAMAKSRIGSGDAATKTPGTVLAHANDIILTNS